MRTKKGIVTGIKMTNTATVTVDRALFHPIYKKRFKRSKKYLVDPNGHDIAVGDKVMITECRPISKRKCFQVTEILDKAAQVGEVKEEEALKEVMEKPEVEKAEDSNEESEKLEVKSEKDDTKATQESEDTESSENGESSPESNDTNDSDSKS